ncbi:ubiA prenyltransferase family protein [Hirsutella rhossiliensis]
MNHTIFAVACAALSKMLRLRSSIFNLIHILWLFTASDIKTILVPVSVFAYGVAPTPDSSHAIQASLWIWLHLLHFNISNQVIGIAEDEQNKSYRPLTSGRITIQHARVLQRVLFAVCIVQSYGYSIQVVFASVALLTLTFAHNELGGHAHFVARNLLNSGGISCFEWGATLVAGSSPHGLDQVAQRAICVNAVIIFTTIHAQDFKDIKGDMVMNRSTLPIMYPRQSRKTILPGLCIWTLLCCKVWEVNYIASFPLALLAIWVGLRFFFLTTMKNDEFSYVLYNIWMVAIYLLPAYWRLGVEKKGLQSRP